MLKIVESLEKVIKQKCKFTGRTGWREEDYFILYKRSFYEYDYIPLYISNNEVRSENIITLLKEMKSLIVFFFSCVKYDEGVNDTDEETRKLHCKLEFHADPLSGPWGRPLDDSEIDLTDSIFSESLHLYGSPIRFIESVIGDIRTKGYYMSFEDSFTFTIIISLIRIDLERFIINPDVIGLDRFAFNPNINLDNVHNRINKNNNEGIIPINEGKTFKEDKCMVCLDEEPNILFCKCGHLCACKECWG